MSGQSASTSRAPSPARVDLSIRVGQFELSRRTFTICKSEPDGQICSRSTTSSVCAEINSTPDKDSIPPYHESDDEVDSEGVSDVPEIAFFGTGYWQDKKPSDIFVPWRIEPVTHEDLAREIDDLVLESQESRALRNKSIAKEAKGLQKWRHGLTTSGSVTESADSSMPGMTEGSSRDTDSICCSDRANQIEVNRMDVVVYNAVSSHDEVSATFSTVPMKLDIMELGMFKDEANQFGPDSIPRHIDANDFPEVGTEQSRHPCSISPIKLDSMQIARRFRENETSSASDSESSDEDSAWMSDYAESVPVLEDGHPFLQIKSEVAREALRRFESYSQLMKGKHVVQAWPQTDAEKSTLSGSTTCSSASGTSSRSSCEKKRTHDRPNSNEGDEQDKDNGGDDKPPPRKRGRTSKRSSGRKPSLACPYAKKDALKYRSCYSYTLNRTQDVKQHLSRCHQLPIYCPRCKETFNLEAERDAHLMQNTTALCEARNIVHEGVTREQKDLLGRRVRKGMALEDQWFAIFDILFPNHRPRPNSAYVNTSLTEDLEAFLDMMVTEGPNIIVSTLNSRNIALDSVSNPEHDLSSLYEVVFREAVQNIANKWTEELVQNPSALDADTVDDSVTSGASGPKAFSEQSGSTSDTLVASRSNSRQPLPPSTRLRAVAETSLNTAAMPVSEVDQAGLDEMVFTLENESHGLAQIAMDVQHTPNGLQADLSNENQMTVDFTGNVTNLFQPMEILPLESSFEGTGPPEPLDDFFVTDDFDASVMNKIDNGSSPAYVEWDTEL